MKLNWRGDDGSPRSAVNWNENLIKFEKGTIMTFKITNKSDVKNLYLKL